MNNKKRDNKGRLLFMGETQEKSGRYRYSYVDALGKRREVYSWRLTEADPIPTGRRTDKPLRDKEKDIQKKQFHGIATSNMTVNELVERYLMLKRAVKHSTEANYKFVKNILAKEPFGNKHIDAVRLSDAKLFLIKLQREDGKGHSSIHTIRGVLRPAFQMAVDDDLLMKNPFAFQLGTIIVNDSEKREAVTTEQKNKFLDFVRSDKHYNKYYDAFALLFATGLRISEFCGLTVKDLDFEHGKINIYKQLQRTRDMEYVIETPKTSSGTRQLSMTPEVRAICERMVSNRKKPKVEPMIKGHSRFLYFDKNGKAMVALHWEKYMKHALDKYNREHQVLLPTITPHICRHTYCTEMAKSGMNPKTLQYLMGHSEISVTLNVYTHLGFEDAKEEIERLFAANQ
jgi:integrase